MNQLQMIFDHINRPKPYDPHTVSALVGRLDHGFVSQIDEKVTQQCKHTYSKQQQINQTMICMMRLGYDRQLSKTLQYYNDNKNTFRDYWTCYTNYLNNSKIDFKSLLTNCCCNNNTMLQNEGSNNIISQDNDILSYLNDSINMNFQSDFLQGNQYFTFNYIDDSLQYDSFYSCAYECEPQNQLKVNNYQKLLEQQISGDIFYDSYSELYKEHKTIKSYCKSKKEQISQSTDAFEQKLILLQMQNSKLFGAVIKIDKQVFNCQIRKYYKKYHLQMLRQENISGQYMKQRQQQNEQQQQESERLQVQQLQYLYRELKQEFTRKSDLKRHIGYYIDNQGLITHQYNNMITKYQKVQLNYQQLKDFIKFKDYYQFLYQYKFIADSSISQLQNDNEYFELQQAFQLVQQKNNSLINNIDYLVQLNIKQLLQEFCPNVFYNQYSDQSRQQFNKLCNQQEDIKNKFLLNLQKNQEQLLMQEGNIKQIISNNQIAQVNVDLIKQQYIQLSDQIKFQQTKNAEFVQEINSKIQQTKQNINTIQIEYHEKRNEHQQLQKQLNVIINYTDNDLTNQMANNQDLVVKYKKETISINIEIQKQEEKLAELEKFKQELLQKQEEFEAKVKKYQSKMEIVQNDMDTLVQQLQQDVNMKIKAFNTDYNNLKTILNNVKVCQRDIDQAQVKISKVENDILSLEEQNKKLEKQILEIKQQ